MATGFEGSLLTQVLRLGSVGCFLVGFFFLFPFFSSRFSLSLQILPGSFLPSLIHTSRQALELECHPGQALYSASPWFCSLTSECRGEAEQMTS